MFCEFCGSGPTCLQCGRGYTPTARQPRLTREDLPGREVYDLAPSILDSARAPNDDSRTHNLEVA